MHPLWRLAMLELPHERPWQSLLECTLGFRFGPFAQDFQQKRCCMIFSMTCKSAELREPVETAAAAHITKLGKLLNSYSPDAVQLRAVIAKMARKEEYSLTLNLSLPTGNLHCVGTGSHVRASLKMAFAELESQIKKHKDHLRHDAEWKRKRRRAGTLA